MKDNPVQGTGGIGCPGTEFGWSSALTKPHMLPLCTALTHAVTSGSWKRMRFRLETLVTRLSHSHIQGAQIIRAAVTHFQVVWVLSPAYFLWKAGWGRGVFLLLGRLEPFASFLFLSSWMLRVAPFQAYSECSILLWLGESASFLGRLDSTYSHLQWSLLGEPCGLWLSDVLPPHRSESPCFMSRKSPLRDA